MKVLAVSIVSICLMTCPILCEENIAATYENGESRDSSYGSSSSYGHGSYNNHYPYPMKQVSFDLGIPLVVGGLGLGLGVGALKGLVLGAILGKKKYSLFQSLKHAGYGSGYGGYGAGYGSGYGGYGGGSGGYGSGYGGYGSGYGGYGSGYYRRR